MPKPPIAEQDLTAIEDAVRPHKAGIPVSGIAKVLPADLPRRTLQYRLKHLVEAHRLVKEGEGRWAKYLLPTVVEARGEASVKFRVEGVGMALSAGGTEIRDYLGQPPEARKPVGYNREFLELIYVSMSIPSG